jgi:hypothetical protein
LALDRDYDWTRPAFKRLNHIIEDVRHAGPTYDKGDLRRAWNEILKAYTNCSLTKETDKLVALSGITQEIANCLQYNYLAGLWKERLERQLLWTCRPPNKGTRPSTYIAPSWSWASVVGVAIQPDQWFFEPTRLRDPLV